MSMGPLGGVAGSAAGSPLAQTAGSDVERAQQDVGSQQRHVQSDKNADNAAGIGETDGEDHETADRDANGRRPWEKTPQKQSSDEPQEDSTSSRERRGKDTTGQCGNLLDLSG